MYIGCLVASVLIKITDTSLVQPLTMSEGEIEETCGAEYCPEEAYFYNDTLLHPTIAPNTSRMIVSVWLGLAVLAFGISCAFLDARMKEPQGLQDRLSTEAILKSVKHAFQDPKMQLAAPLTLFIGLEQGFIFADFTEVSAAAAAVNSSTISSPRYISGEY